MSPRPVALAVLLVLATASCSSVYRHEHPICRDRPATRLIAESVETASMVPCVRALPIGWRFSGFDASQGAGSFWLGSDTAGDRAVEVTLQRGCVRSGQAAPSAAPGVKRYVDVRSASPYLAVWVDVFEGGCVRYRLAFAAGARTKPLLAQLERGLSLIPRASLS